MAFRLVFLVFLFSLFFGCSPKSTEEFLARSVAIDGKEYRYRVLLPKNRDPNKKVGVMLYLHGSGSRGDDNESQIGDIADFIKQDREKFQFIIVFPQCREDTFWAGEMTEQAIAALDATVREFNGDENRLYLAGFSMGGYGAWQTAITYPGKFAAVVPIAGGIVPNGPISEDQRAILSPAVRTAADAEDPYRAFAEAMGKTPVWIVHGDRDGIVPVDGARKIFAALKVAGNPNVKYTELENVEHYSVGGAFGDPKFFEWLGRQKLTR